MSSISDSRLTSQLTSKKDMKFKNEMWLYKMGMLETLRIVGNVEERIVRLALVAHSMGMFYHNK